MNFTQEMLVPFREIQVKFSRLYARILSQAELTLPQYALLSLLVLSGECSMTEVSQKLHITKPAVTHLVDHLERKCFLKRSAVAGDRRVHRLEVTSKGSRAVKAIQQKVFQFLLATLKHFSDSQKKVISDFYRQLAVTLNDFLLKEENL